MSDQDNKNNFSSLVLGVIIGATITYLLTNKKGQKIKDHLLAEGKKLLEDVADIASETTQNITKKLEEGKPARRSLGVGGDQIEEKVEETAVEIPKHIGEIQKKGRRFFFRRSHPNPES